MTTTPMTIKACAICNFDVAEGFYSDRELIYGARPLCNTCCKAYDACKAFMEDRLTKKTTMTVDGIAEALDTKNVIG